ncbi:TadE/TadG family type IV pilus assembly protein [Chloroflexota bacterium]
MKIKQLQSKRAQTMVEFALILPVLLVMLIGMLEVGRMVFVYITVASASREAVRYGSASGENTALTFQRYKDCEGIREAAENVDVLNIITDIRISYDHGPSGPAWDSAKFGSDQCDGTNTTKINGCEPGSYPLLCYKDRIKVEVDGLFTPIVSYIPLEAQALSSTNYHTILDVIEVKFSTGTLIPTGTIVPTTTLSFTSTPENTATPTDPPAGPSPTPACELHSNNPYISTDYSTIYWELVNDNTFDLVIKNIYLTWPDGSGLLTKIMIDSTEYDVSLSPPTQNIETISKPLSSGSHLFSFKFQHNPLSGHFQVSVAFSNDKCAVAQKAYTVWPVTHSGPVPAPLFNEYITQPWVLYNHTDQVLNIASIELVFPCGGGNDLYGLYVGSQDWTGSGYISSCTGTIITPFGMTIPPGPTNIQFRFQHKNTAGVTAKVTLQCYGIGVTTTCQTVDSTNSSQITNP